MKFTLKWLLTASVLAGLANASAEDPENYDLLERLIPREAGVEDSSLVMRLIDLLEEREAAQDPFEVELRDDSQPAPSENAPGSKNPAPTTAAPTTTACSTTSSAPWTVITPTGSLIVMASQGVTHTYSLNATGTATATSTVVLVVTDHPKPSKNRKNAANNMSASLAFTGMAIVGAVLTTYVL